MLRLDALLFVALHKLWGANRFSNALILFFANLLTYFLVAGMFVFILFSSESWQARIFLASEMFLAFIFARWVVAGTISILVARPRPFVKLRFTPPFVPLTIGAMPSGHMSGLFSIALIMFTIDVRWGIAYFISCFFIGIGRIIVGVHWPSDILAGILVGLGGGWVVYLLSPVLQFFVLNSEVVGFLK